MYRAIVDPIVKVTDGGRHTPTRSYEGRPVVQAAGHTSRGAEKPGTTIE